MSDKDISSADAIAEEAQAVLASIKAKGGSKAKVLTKRKRKMGIRTVPIVHIYVHASFNNTLLTACDVQGDTLAWSSAGVCGFRGPKKATPYAANVTTRVLMEKIKIFQVKEAHVYVKGVGNGREAAIRSINSAGISVLSIHDTTPIPHNGCRRRKARRV